MDYRTFSPLVIGLAVFVLFARPLVLHAQPSASQPVVQFDTAAARAAGYTDADIRLFLDSANLRAAGFSASEVNPYLDSIRKANGEPNPYLAPEEKSSTAEALGSWLWLLPVTLLLMLVVASLRASRMKAWIGSLHWGQLLILSLGLLGSGYIPLLVALFGFPTVKHQEWVLGFVPLGFFAALLVLWHWFGARNRRSRDA